jgi:hypothetical protein
MQESKKAKDFSKAALPDEGVLGKAGWRCVDVFAALAATRCRCGQGEISN